jgi:glutamate N-acetyltransferase/amino-acid N-acetyltransferase
VCVVRKNMNSDVSGLPEIHPVPGFRLGTACAAIKSPGRRDLVIMALAEGSACTAVFTRNAFCAAPVTVAREHLVARPPKYLLVNTGNANAGTGSQGIRDARQCCALLADLAGCPLQAVVPFSTGVIGEPLPVSRIADGLPAALAHLSENGWTDAAHGIMTTDTVAKLASRRLDLDGHSVTVTGMAKGAGMIRPDMATMLAFVATDAALDEELLHACLERAVAGSFNRITVDGDTSTNDACVLVASGRSSLPRLTQADDYYERLAAAVADVCRDLAKAIVRDGEGATKFVTIAVEQGATTEECLQVAYTIAHSPLVKTALFASDPNWGRILAAVGRAGLRDLNVDDVTIYLDTVCIVRDGARALDYTEAAGQDVLRRKEFAIRVMLGRGECSQCVWTCDLSYDYVRINAEYRS